MDILDDMRVSKLSAKVFFFKVNYSFNYKPGFSILLIVFLLFCCLQQIPPELFMRRS